MGQVNKVSNNENKNVEMKNNFDFEEYERLLEEDTLGRGAEYEKDDGTLIMMMNNPPIISEYPPSPSFAKLISVYYPSGKIQYFGELFGENVPVGVWQVYDENGNLKEEKDENAKFQEIKPQNILEFLHKKGHIDLESGEGRFIYEREPGFTAQYIEEDKNTTSKWIIQITDGVKYSEEEYNEMALLHKGEPTEYTSLVYEIDGKSGKVTKLNN